MHKCRAGSNVVCEQRTEEHDHAGCEHDQDGTETERRIELLSSVEFPVNRIRIAYIYFYGTTVLAFEPREVMGVETIELTSIDSKDREKHSDQ